MTLVLSDAERGMLQSLAARRKTAQDLALQARIVLACADGPQQYGDRGASGRQSGHRDYVAGRPKETFTQ